LSRISWQYTINITVSTGGCALLWRFGFASRYLSRTAMAYKRRVCCYGGCGASGVLNHTFSTLLELGSGTRVNNFPMGGVLIQLSNTLPSNTHLKSLYQIIWFYFLELKEYCENNTLSKQF
jgi:hypothetical protein